MNKTSTKDSNESKPAEDKEAPGERFPRGTDLPPHSPLFWVQNKDRYLRQLLLRDIQRDTGRPLAVYFASSALRAEITQDDIARLYEMVRPFHRKSFDLLIETSGGDTDAAEGLVNMLRGVSSDFRVIVANRAKSNGTLMCLAAAQIIMGVTSELGPIEPSVDTVPATILITDEYKKIGYLMSMMGSYALEQTRKVAITLLQTGMLSSEQAEVVEAVATTLTSRTVFPSHGSVINHKEAKKMNLNILFLEEDATLWRKIWLLYSMYVFDARTRGLSKIFEQETYSISVAGSDPVNDATRLDDDGI